MVVSGVNGSSSGGGVRGGAVERVVNRGHRRINFLNSGRVTLRRGSFSKMHLKIESSSGESGRMVLKKSGLSRYA